MLPNLASLILCLHANRLKNLWYKKEHASGLYGNKFAQKFLEILFIWSFLGSKNPQDL